MSATFNYGIDPLTIGKTIDIASGKTRGMLGKAAIKKIRTSHRHVEEIVRDNRTVYGINTGFGILANTAISEEDTATLQHKILQSHSVGVGDPIPVEVARIMLVTKMHALSQGYSGVKLETLRRRLAGLKLESRQAHGAFEPEHDCDLAARDVVAWLGARRRLRAAAMFRPVVATDDAAVPRRLDMSIKSVSHGHVLEVGPFTGVGGPALGQGNDLG